MEDKPLLFPHLRCPSCYTLPLPCLPSFWHSRAESSRCCDSGSVLFSFRDFQYYVGKCHFSFWFSPKGTPIVLSLFFSTSFHTPLNLGWASYHVLHCCKWAIPAGSCSHRASPWLPSFRPATHQAYIAFIYMLTSGSNSHSTIWVPPPLTTPRVPERLPGDPQGQNYFLIASHYFFLFFFTLSVPCE